MSGTLISVTSDLSLTTTRFALWLAMARKIWLTVKPLAKKESIEERSDTDFVVSIHAPARDGKANAQLVEILADHFHTGKSRVRIVRGHSSRKKLIAID